jgi:tetratricopeptide (TPR) repeat protein
MASDAPSRTLTRSAPRIGAESSDQVFLIENHDEAYNIWRNAGAKKRTLVHIDAHHDMWWVGDKAIITIANFICPALKQDLLQEVFWVVPDATFQDAKSRKPVLQHLKEILKKYPGTSSIVIEDHRITAFVLEKKLTICPLRSLPVLREAVLLDIDVDYLVIPKVSYEKRDHHALLPWCWPNDLIKRLHDTGIRSDLVTVVYSVEGGYTPLQWKYLGQELVLRLKEPLSAGSEMAGMCCMRQAAEAEQQGQAVIAESKYREAQELLPKSAAAPYRLARLLVSLGRVEEGRRFYGQAVGLDDSYKSAYSSSGFHCFWKGEFAAAEREFQDSLTLDPSDAYSQLGLGLLAKKRKQWREAEQRLRTALTLNDCLLDAQRALGDVLAKLGRKRNAMLAYERALKLGLKGYRPLNGPILTYAGEKRLLDPWHCDTHARLAGLYARQGATVKAINALRISIAGGLDSTSPRLLLARLYWKQGQWQNFAVHAWQAIKMAPKDIWASGWHNLQDAVRLADRPWPFGKNQK